MLLEEVKKEAGEVVTGFHYGLQCKPFSLVSMLRRPCQLGGKAHHSITLGENLKVQSLTGYRVKKNSYRTRGKLNIRLKGCC
jgi:hypothetical protein